MVSEQRYEKAMAAYKEFGGDVFLKVHLGLLRFLEGDCTAANVLAYILNRLRVMDGYHATRQQLINDGLYIKVPSEEILNDMGISEYLKHKAIKTLEEKGLLLTKHGRGNGLLIKVRWKGLEEATKSESKNSRIQKFKNLKPSDSESKNLRFPTIDKEEKKELGSPQGNGEQSPASLNGRFNLDKIIGNGHPSSEKLAARLFQVLLKHRKLTRYYEQSPVKKWAKEFATLLQVFPVDEIREVIERYDVGIKDKFVPQGYCGKTFCEKYVKIKEALVRVNLLEPAPENPDDGQRTVEWRENGKLFKKIISN